MPGAQSRQGKWESESGSKGQPSGEWTLSHLGLGEVISWDHNVGPVLANDPVIVHTEWEAQWAPLTGHH
jgi:hypothetical protein